MLGMCQCRFRKRRPRHQSDFVGAYPRSYSGRSLFFEQAANEQHIKVKHDISRDSRDSRRMKLPTSTTFVRSSATALVPPCRPIEHSMSAPLVGKEYQQLLSSSN